MRSGTTARGSADARSLTSSISPLLSAVSTTAAAVASTLSLISRSARGNIRWARCLRRWSCSTPSLLSVVPRDRTVGDRVERDAPSRQEGLVITQHGLALGVARQRIHVLFRQPHHRTEVAQSLIVRAGIDDGVDGVDVWRVDRDTGGLDTHRLSLQRLAVGCGLLGGGGQNDPKSPNPRPGHCNAGPA